MTYQPPRGTRDFLPEEMAKRRGVFEKIRAVFESYGYGEISTPAFEDFELLSKKSGADIEKEIYAFKDKGGRKLGLRFDPTVPICRIIASNPSLTKPAKFYYITNMWRYDKPQAGRWREFWQAGVELIGSSKPEADAELLAIVNDSLKAIGIDNFVLKINSRKIVEALADNAGIPKAKRLDAFRAIDKLDKFGEAVVEKEMAGYKIPKESINKFIASVKSTDSSIAEVKELQQITAIAKKMGVKRIDIDFSIVRGIDYYTGFVFETLVKGSEKLGSVASGGRYDELIKVYSGRDTPATGFGIGVDRLMETLKQSEDYSPVAVFIATVNDEVRGEAIEIAQMLRKKKISSEFDLGGRNLRKQFNYCNSKKIPWCVIVGPKELKAGAVVLRNMRSGKEEKVKLDKLVLRLK